MTEIYYIVPFRMPVGGDTELFWSNCGPYRLTEPICFVQRRDGGSILSFIVNATQTVKFVD